MAIQGHGIHRVMFGWTIVSILVSLACAEAISVSSNSPFAYNIATKTRRILPQQKQARRQFAAPPPTRHPLELDDDEDDDDTELSTSYFPGRGGAVDAKASTSSAWVEGWKNSLASALAAAFSKTILAPFDTIKTLQQYHQTSATMSSLSLMQAARMIMERPGGFGNFYAGLGVSVVGAMPSVAMYFGTYSYFKNALSQPIQRKDGTTYQLPKTLSNGVAAALGNTLASFSRVPYEVLKQKLQTNAYRNTWEALCDIKSLEMIFPKGGIAIQMMRDIPYAVVTMVLYENFQAWNSKQQRKKQQQSASSLQQSSQQATSDLLLGGLAGGVGSYVTNPLDVIKTRLQTAPKEVYNGSISKCVADTWQEGGGMAFLRGSWPRLMHKIPANAFFFVFYEFFRRALKCSEY